MKIRHFRHLLVSFIMGVAMLKIAQVAIEEPETYGDFVIDNEKDENWDGIIIEV